MTTPRIQTSDTHFTRPGLVSAHSHAFQRALRGRTQRRATAATAFWSWRGLMYELAAALDPDDIYTNACLAYAELAMSGVTAIGEFHYLHHDRDGRPYANRTETAEACIRATLEVGIRIGLIRPAYMRGSFQKALNPAQRRFADADVALVLNDVTALQKRFNDNPCVTAGVAAYSVHAVPLAQIQAWPFMQRRTNCRSICTSGSSARSWQSQGLMILYLIIKRPCVRWYEIASYEIHSPPPPP